MRMTKLVPISLILSAATLTVAGPAEAIVRARGVHRAAALAGRRGGGHSQGSGDNLPDGNGPAKDRHADWD